MSNDLITRALAFAFKAHAGQTRKYDGQDYIQHPVRVAMRVAQIPGTMIPSQAVLLAAALLHDVVEDCGVTLDTLRAEFGADVAALVDELTDKFTKEAYPRMNRKARKAAEAQRLCATSWNARAIKLADIADNLRSMDPADDFAKVFIEEKRALLADSAFDPRVVPCTLVREVEEASAALAALPARSEGRGDGEAR